MSESRGAASVTLDTIIANVLKDYSPMKVMRMGDGHNSIVEQTFDPAEWARAVTDALLAKGSIVWNDPNPIGVLYSAAEYVKPRKGIFIPIPEPSS